MRSGNYYQDYVSAKVVDSMNDQAAATLALCGLLDELNTLIHLAFYDQIMRNAKAHEANQQERYEGRDTAVPTDTPAARDGQTDGGHPDAGGSGPHAG